MSFNMMFLPLIAKNCTQRADPKMIPNVESPSQDPIQCHSNFEIATHHANCLVPKEGYAWYFSMGADIDEAAMLVTYVRTLGTGQEVDI